MIIYNTTYHVEASLAEAFIVWLRTDYIPAALRREELSEPQLCRVMSESEDSVIRFKLQFHVTDTGHLNRWYEECGFVLAEEMKRRFADRVVGFTTLLEVIDL